MALDNLDDDGSLDLDLLTASLRADAQDVLTFIEALAVKLEEALPQTAVITRVRQGLRGPKVVKEIAVNFGAQRLGLLREGNGVVGVLSRTSGGIVLKTERLDLDAWIEALGERLAEAASHSDRARQTLERLLLDS